MRNQQGRWIPNISDFVYYRTTSGIFPARVISIFNPDSFNPIITLEGHIAIHEGKRFEVELSDIKSIPSDWKNIRK